MSTLFEGKSDDIDSSQCYGDGKRNPFFKRDRCRLDCKGVKDCEHDTKEDGSPINYKACIEERFNEPKK